MALPIMAQEVQQRFYPEGTTWVEKTTNILESTYRYDNYLVGGDTVIGGKDYNKLLINGRATGLLARGWWQGLYV